MFNISHTHLKNNTPETGVSIHKCCQQERRTSIYILIDNIFLSCYTHPKNTESKKSLHKKINYTIDPRRRFQDVERSTEKIKGRAIVSVVKKSQILNFFYWVVIKRTRVATKPPKSSDSGECALQRVGGRREGYNGGSTTELF